MRYSRPLRDLVEGAELTNEPEQEWLKAVNLQGGKKIILHDHSHTALARSFQLQPPIGSKEAFTNARKEILCMFAFPAQGEKELQVPFQR